MHKVRPILRRPYYEFCLQEHGVESGPAENQNRIEHTDPPRADLRQSVPPSYQQQNHRTDSQAQLENDDLGVLMYDRTRKRIQFPYTSHITGNEGTEKIVNIQHGN